MSEYNKNSRMSQIKKYVKAHDNTSVVITKTKDMVNTFTIIAMENEYIDFSQVS